MKKKPAATIEFYLYEDGHIEISVFNISGQKVRTFASGHFNRGIMPLSGTAVKTVYTSFVRDIHFSPENERRGSCETDDTPQVI